MSTAPKPTKSFFSCCCCAEEEKKETIIEVPDRRPQPLPKPEPPVSGGSLNVSQPNSKFRFTYQSPNSK